MLDANLDHQRCWMLTVDKLIDIHVQRALEFDADIFNFVPYETVHIEVYMTIDS